jgi:hypothetical protein
VAPAFMVFNDVRVEAQPGDSPVALRERWAAEMDRKAREYQAKRLAYEQTPEGKAELAAAKRRADDERRLRAETLANVERSGVRAKYAWQPGMGEISGFGGGYEAACLDMLYTGLAWLDAHPGAALDDETRKSLDKAICAACPDCSGAMHGAVMSACGFVLRNGWAKYVAAMSKRVAAAEKTP